jgi:hypothetical protein
MYLSTSSHNLPITTIKAEPYKRESSQEWEVFLTIDYANLNHHDVFGRITMWLSLQEAETMMNELLNVTRHMIEEASNVNA